jgi:predicted site-specific integrase-resolvase
MWSAREAAFRLCMSTIKFSSLVRRGKIKPESGEGMSAQFSEEEIARYDALLGDKEPELGLIYFLPEEKDTYYSDGEAVKWLNIAHGRSTRVLRDATMKLNPCKRIFSHDELKKAHDSYQATGLTCYDVASMLGCTPQTARDYLATRDIRPVAYNSEYMVYNHKEVINSMKSDGRKDTNFRLQRVEGSARPNDKLWYVIKINREEQTLTVISDELRTYYEAVDELKAQLSPF